MDKQPLVTIAISAYNHELYIEESINSALQQTYPNIELIVIDDGSTDSTPDIIEKLSMQHSFYFKRQKNEGLSSTLNKILAMAKGKYFAPLGSDDCILEHKTETQVVVMEVDNNIALCGGNIIEIDHTGKKSTRTKLPKRRELTFDDLFLNLKPGLPAPTLMYRTEHFKHVGGYESNIRLEDVYSELLLAYSGFKIVGLEETLAYYRVHPNNTYKNYQFMLDNVLQTFAMFKEAKTYETAKNKFLISMFVKVARKDKTIAKNILSQINPKYYSFRVIKGLYRLLTS
ncbi:MAG: glycosyltransferase family 2 protein [Candidatus Thioglobus sp.]